MQQILMVAFYCFAPQAIQMLDRFLSKPNSCRHYLNDHKQFQLLAVAALYVAIKTNEDVTLSSINIVEITRSTYTVKDIEATELILLQGLGWQTNAPTSLQMAQHLLSLLSPHINVEESAWSSISEETKFQTECAVRDYYLSTQTLPSVVGMAAVLNSVHAVLGEQTCADLMPYRWYLTKAINLNMRCMMQEIDCLVTLSVSAIQLKLRFRYQLLRNKDILNSQNLPFIYLCYFIM